MRIKGSLLALCLSFALPAQAGFVDDFCNWGTDVDGDGLHQYCDNCLLVANPDQTDTDGDGCGNRCDADFNQDGVVGIADFSPIALNFGSTVPPASPLFDLSSPPDGAIGIGDFSIYSIFFGGPPGPSGATSGTIACP